MYPSTTFEIIDQSQIAPLAMPEKDELDRPYFMQVFASPKGPEEWMNGLMGSEVTDYYGQNPSFAKYGQPLLQTVMLAATGARLVTKRVVSDKATLANILVYAELVQKVTQAVDENGLLIYYDRNGDETNVVSNANDDTTGVPYKGSPLNQNGTGPDCKTVSTLKIIFHAEPYGNGWTRTASNLHRDWATPILKDNMFDYSAPIGTAGLETDFYPSNNVTAQKAKAIYPLFLITDNGRGISNKSFSIHVDETARRPVNYIRYILSVYEDGKRVERMAFTFNPDQIEMDNNIGIANVIKEKSKQIRGYSFEDSVKSLMDQIASFTKTPYSEVAKNDIIFNTDTYGKTIKGVQVEYSGNFSFAPSITSPAGIALEGGTNDGGAGNWDFPINAPDYEAELANAFSESFDDCIYDFDNFPVYLIADANYPATVKRAIEEYVGFRDDIYYMRDMGTVGNTTITQIRDSDKNNKESRAIGTYHNYFEIKDPISRKYITVTMTLLAAIRFVDHYINGLSRPFCGIRYGVTFPEVIEGTLNFAPKVTPSGDQKQLIDDLRINYAGWYNGQLVMETNYTSQRRNTELDYMCNVIAIQNLIRRIRSECPKIRYAFFTEGANGNANSLEKYVSDVQSVIDKCAPNFAKIVLKYERNNVYENNKIFYAAIDLSNPDWIQSERFKITVLQNN